MGDFDFLEPIPKTTVSVKLPSRGVLYPKGTPQASGQLNMSPMTMIEEAMFSNPSRAGGMSPTDRVLKKCIQDSVDISTLLVSDKVFLFYMLRAITYGPEYSFNWTCQAPRGKGVCGHKNTTTVRIPDDFQMKYLADEDKEPFVVTLPETQRKVAFRLLRGYDEPEIEKYAERLEERRSQGLIVEDTTAAYRLSRQILTVDDRDVTKAPEDKILRFLLSLPLRDSQFLRNKIAYYTPGINTDVHLRCAECKAEEEGDLPITVNFFRVVDPDEGGPVGAEVRPDVLPGDEPLGDHEDGDGGADVVPREAPGDKEGGDGDRKVEARRDTPRRVGRSYTTRRR